MASRITGQITLRDLEYVLAVAEHGHFGKAAGSCFVSQPALSGQIKKLEALLKVKIFERSSRRVSITPEGQAVIDQIKLVVLETEKLVSLQKRSRLPLEGQFRLGAIATLGPYLIPHILGPLRKAYPKLQLQLREGLTENLLSDLREGRLDAALVSPPLPEDGFQIIDLFSEPLVLAVPKGHELATKLRLTLHDLNTRDMILLEDGHCLKDQTVSLCDQSKRSGAKSYQATGLETLKHLVASGLGYSLIPSLAVPKHDALSKLMVYRKFQEPVVSRPIALACRKTTTAMGDIEAIAQAIKNAMQTSLKTV